jgi:hypothetical protein
LLRLAFEFNLDLRTTTFGFDNFERPMLHVILNGGVIELAADQTLCI